MAGNLASFVARWSQSGAAERANKDTFLSELCTVLDVPSPDPKTSDPDRDVYVFEKDVRLHHEQGVATVWIDLYKEGCFILEAKQGSDPTSKKLGAAKRETPGWHVAMNDAFGQALGYARTFEQPPPFIVVCDIGYCFDFYSSFDRSGHYDPFPDAGNKRIYLDRLGESLPTLRAIFLDPLSLNPALRAAKVTREVAGHLAGLARSLEDDGNPPELVAQFLMRCIFTMFAEDVGLLPDRCFTSAIEERWLPSPRSFPGGVEALWRRMNEGGEDFALGKILKFNGGLFRDPTPLPLTKGQLQLLLLAALADWSEVEPAIFGTLLERALDPKKRQALGAHFTPRAYVERLVRPTLEEPLRKGWDVVRAQVRRLVGDGKIGPAKEAVRAFHQSLCQLRVLDPACGSGNFLYVALDLFKRVENEVLQQLADLGERQQLLEVSGVRVSPSQFLGIEKERWAKEIAELVLWIGYLQWHVRAVADARLPVPEPVLRDYGNIQCRDAVLSYESEVLVRDERGVPCVRWDGVTMKTSPSTGELVPDTDATVPVYDYVDTKAAEWPTADYIVGNPPFVGNKRMREVLGERYVDALRAAYPDVPETSDLVMYWWHIAAELTRKQPGCQRFGLVSTKAITQVFNSKVVQTQLESKPPLSIVFAIPNHPWVEGADGAAVRVAMSVAERGQTDGVVAEVVAESPPADDRMTEYDVTLRSASGKIHSDFHVGADIRSAKQLRANRGLCQQGVKLVQPRKADGFVVRLEDLPKFGGADGRIVKPFLTNRELMQHRKHRYVIDFFGLGEAEAQRAHPEAFQRVIDQVLPFRRENRDAQRRREWWLFGRSNERMRASVEALARFVVTPEVAKHRVFVFEHPPLIADASLYVIGSDDAFVLGVLSSRVHTCWALRAGGRMGVGDDPRYENGPCFETFPFPACSDALAQRIRERAEDLDGHRKRQLARFPSLTLTSMYNVLEKLRADVPLDEDERKVHEMALTSNLRALHDSVDEAVVEGYGWPNGLSDDEILERVLFLNFERADAERRGLVAWLRPAFQAPSGTEGPSQVEIETGESPDDGVKTVAVWPTKLPEQVAAVRTLLAGTAVGGWSVQQVAAEFKKAKAEQVEAVLECLAAVGVAISFETGGVRRWGPAAQFARTERRSSPPAAH